MDCSLVPLWQNNYDLNSSGLAEDPSQVNNALECVAETLAYCAVAELDAADIGTCNVEPGALGKGGWHWNAPLLEANCQVVFTDGACQNIQWKCSRIAGCGAFWADEHPFNADFALFGDEQTNNRAELRAVLYATRIELRPVEIRTDSAYVTDGYEKLKQNKSHKFDESNDLLLNYLITECTLFPSRK